MAVFDRDYEIINWFDLMAALFIKTNETLEQ